MSKCHICREEFEDTDIGRAIAEIHSVTGHSDYQGPSAYEKRRLIDEYAKDLGLMINESTNSIVAESAQFAAAKKALASFPDPTGSKLLGIPVEKFEKPELLKAISLLQSELNRARDSNKTLLELQEMRDRLR